MTETCDVVVTIGEAKLFNAQLAVPELRTTMDFTAVPEWTLLGISMDRLAELRALGLDVLVQRSYRDGEVIAEAIGDGRQHEVTDAADETSANANVEAGDGATADEETAPPVRGRGRNRSA